MSLFLCKHLLALEVEDPFLITKNERLVDILKACLNGVTMLPVDVFGLYYSLPKDRLLKAMECTIEENG